MSKARLVVLLMTGSVVALIAIAACTSDGSPAPESDKPGVAGPAPGGVLTSQDVESLAAALSAGGPARALAQTLSGQQTGIWATGRGEVTAIPDLALLSLGVEARADTVSSARGEAAEALTAMVSVLTSAGLADTDIQTRNFNIQPQFSSREVQRCEEVSVRPPVGVAIATPEGSAIPIEAIPAFEETCFPVRESIIVGYIVNNQLTAKISDLEGIGEIIDQVADAGGDLVRVQGVSFTVEDPSGLEVQAREEAILALVAKAQQMAEVAGVKLGELVFITESGGGLPRIENQFARALAAPAFAEAAFTPISGGELNVSVTVQGVFSIGE